MASIPTAASAPTARPAIPMATAWPMPPRSPPARIRAASTPFTRQLAEGASSAFFETSVSLMNPSSQPATVVLRFLKDTATTVDLAGDDRAAAPPDDQPGPAGVGEQFVVRDDRRVGSRSGRRADDEVGPEQLRRPHREGASTGPASNWFFAEGSQGFFLTYVLLTNPSTSQNRASVRFLRESGGPIVQEFTLAPLSRRTVDCGAIAALVERVVRHRGDLPRRAGRRRAGDVLRPAAGSAVQGRPRIGRRHGAVDGVVPGRGRDRPLLRDVRADRQPQLQRRERHLDLRHRDRGDGDPQQDGPRQRPHHGEHRGGGLAGAGQRRGGDARAVEHPGGGGAGAGPGPLLRRCGSRRTTPSASPPPARGGAWPKARPAGSSRRTASSCSPTTRTPRRR